MPALPFAQIDAFADRAFTGNPAAVVPLEAWLDDAVLQRIAAENNLSETAFFVADASGEADFELRWFTPAVEVELCGHATLASGHYLLSSDAARERVTFRTRQSGVLEVARDGDGDGYAMALPAYPPEPAEVPGLLDALRVEGETLWHPRGYDLTVVESAEIVRGLTPDFRALAATGNTLNIVTAPGDGGVDVVSRVFAPAVGLDEDPVTGSAHAVLAPYWAKRLGRNRFTAFQASARGGHVGCLVEGNRVVLGGRCVTVIEGRFFA
ncbi:PhzF family phenazine biosynthesis protein [Sphingomonas sp. S2-65]|uniref:PhzF family phenazine biosynthesis protein n=1 Tax=Sphingomonas sp. S2-65 TaxID=2903960 RepID=UPI001F47BC7E|nr:PhzF family phenazine biosynthesis protein [Sphingomonas sp. S2-65]UYY56922.1 PhzF family phenazine biosynthesis protein [Sphingomonas sp. S2-65]